MKKKANILLVEDDPMDIELTLNAFKEVRLENDIHIVTSGEEALDYLFGRNRYADRAAHPLPDIVLLDIKLPGLSGLQVLQKIKNTPVLKRIPVIILTSSQEESDRINGYDFGANSYLIKPVTFENFLTVVKQIYDYWLTLNIEAPLV
ncbi:MAG: response regulator [candidate division KSB1 bacterium]|nr:response regulator [candidate division KSB1 bacterium]